MERAHGFFNWLWSVPSLRRLPSTALIKANLDEPTSFGPSAMTERCLGRNQQLVAAALDGLTQHLFGQPARVNVGRVEYVKPSLKTNIDKSACLGPLRPCPKCGKNRRSRRTYRCLGSARGPSNLTPPRVCIPCGNPTPFPEQTCVATE